MKHVRREGTLIGIYETLSEHRQLVSHVLRRTVTILCPTSISPSIRLTNSNVLLKETKSKTSVNEKVTVFVNNNYN